MPEPVTRANPFRARIGWRLRCWADRIDRPGAPKATHVRFTFEDHVGIVFRDDGRGCRLWYYGDQDYERAHTEAGPATGANSTAWLPQRNSGHLMSGRPVHDEAVPAARKASSGPGWPRESPPEGAHGYHYDGAGRYWAMDSEDRWWIQPRPDTSWYPSFPETMEG